MKRLPLVLLASSLVLVSGPASADVPMPLVGSFSHATADAVRGQYANQVWTRGQDCGRLDQELIEKAELEGKATFRRNLGLGIHANANDDDDATHYAQGATMIIHVFINHSGGTWEQAEKDAAGVKARDAKDFYVSHRPASVNLLFDNEGSTNYLFYNPTLAYNIPTDGMTWAITEDALAAIGFADLDGDGARVDDATYFIQDAFHYDNVIFHFQPADRTGRAFASYGYARIVNYTDDPATTWRHEMGHSFGACDEYEEGGQCNGGIDCGACQSTYLPAVINNGNCDLVACPTDVTCVMRNNVDAICTYTDDHWGWAGGEMYRRLVGGGFTPIYQTGSGGTWTWNSVIGGFGYRQTTDSWAVASIRPPVGTDYDLHLYNDNNHDLQLASSAFGGSTTDFVVSDYNHSQRGIEHFQATLFGGVQNTYRVQYESGTSTLYPDGIARAGTWDAADVANVWEVPLFAGETVSFLLDVTSGTPDLNMALYKSNTSTYHAGRSSSVALANTVAAGGTESFSFDVPADDVYGLVIWSDTEVAGTFTIQIGPTPATLAEETPFYSGLDLRLFNYVPNSSYWAFIANRPDVGVDTDLELYSDVNYLSLLESAGSYGLSSMEWLMVDYNHIGLSTDYLRVNRVVDPGNHRTMWEQDPEVAAQIGTNTTFTSPTLGKVWDVFLNVATNYYFRSYQGAFDNGLYLYRSIGDFYQARQDYELFSNLPDASQDEHLHYAAPVSDWYGLLMPVFTESTGSSTLWWGPEFAQAEDVTLTRSDQVVWTNANAAASYWSVFAVRTPAIGDPNVNLYSDADYTVPVLASDQSAPARTLRYVVADFNHSPLGVVYPRYWLDAGASMTTEWEGGSEALAYIDNGQSVANLVWPAGDVAKAWDISVPAGAPVGILVEDLSGNMDLGIELFDSNGAAYYASRGGGVANSDVMGVGGGESVYWLNPGAADFIGLVVYNKNTNGGNYRIRVVDALIVDAPTSSPATLQFAAAPNPWTERATFRLAMPTEGDASIEVLDVQGRLVRSVHRGVLTAGEHRLEWDGRDEAGNRVAPGLYMARLNSNNEQRLLKLVRSN